MIAALATAMLAMLSPKPGTTAPQHARADTTSRVAAIVTRAPLDTSAAVNFRALVAPETVYVGQQATYELGVFLDASVRDRLRRLEAIAPEMRGMMAYEPPAPNNSFPVRAAGRRRYETHVYQRAIFPLSAGRHVIPPARLVYAMPLSSSFFSREESYELRSDSVVIVAVDPPLATRPADWSGAVGALEVSDRLDTRDGRVGNPMLLTVTVRGRGNVSFFPRPSVQVPWASVVPAGERVLLASDSLDIHGAKEFDWVVTPQRAGRLAVPAIRYSYFDPMARRYAVATASALPVSVAPGALASTDTGVSRPRLAVRTQYRGALPPAPYESPVFWLLAALAPIPAAVVFVARRPRRVRVVTRTPRQALLAIGRGGEARDMPALRRAFLDAVSSRLHVSSGALAEPRAIERAARRAGTSAATASATAALLAELNAAAFAPDGSAPADLGARAAGLYLAIDREAVRRPVMSRGAALVVLLCAALAAAATVARAAPPDPSRAEFAVGVATYQRGAYDVAAREFAAIADRVPRAADAWANLGTAAFAAGDTARAAVGWQRALRLEPLAGDVRDRLDLIGASGGIADVPSVPPTPLALAAALLWLAGWLVLAWRARRRRAAGVRRLVGSALAVALALGWAAASIDGRLAARDLAVVARDAPLRVLPDLGADRQGTIRTGEVVRIVDRDGLWERVRADAGRAGWTEVSGLMSIARD